MFGKVNALKVRESMKARNIPSWSALADQAGIHRNSLLPYLQGEKSAYATTFLRLCESLELSPEELISPSDPRDEHGVFNLVRDLWGSFRAQEPETAFFLFGSRACGKSQAFSDYDIGVTAGSKGLVSDVFLEMKEYLSQTVDDLPIKVDLVNFDIAPIWFLSKFNGDICFICGSTKSFDLLQGRIYGIQEANKGGRIAC